MWTKELAERAYELYQSPLNCEEVGKIIGCCGDTVAKMIKSVGGEIRGPHTKLYYARRKPKKPVGMMTSQFVVQLWREGKTFVDISSIADISENQAIEIVMSFEGLKHCKRCGLLIPKELAMCNFCKEEICVVPLGVSAT